jgi:hypothetical protein
VQPDTLASFFARAAARMGLVAGARGVALALGAGVPLLALRWTGALPAAQVLIALAIAVFVVAAMMMWRSPRRPLQVAAEIETRTRAAKNLLVTAAEIETNRTPLRVDVREVVLRDAAGAAARVHLPELFPLKRPLVWIAALAVVWAAGLAVDRTSVARARDRLAGRAPAPEISKVTITVTPPEYTGRAAEVLSDPERVEVIAGSSLRIVAEGSATEIELAAVGQRHRLQASADSRFGGELVASEDGFIALQPFGAGDSAGLRRVIPLSVVQDRAPLARITAPGKDLFLAKPDRTLPVRIEATDDIGVASLRLTFTKVTGSGENFTFVAGEFPLQITRQPAAGRPDTWIATSTLPLPSLGLEPGDLLVYRALVGDRRPGAAPVESDAFVIQIQMPGEALAEGFTIDEEKDRYAISQQMIIIKTERLIANKNKLAPEDFAEQAAGLAAEQRKVRAEFVFMMGGEFEDATTATGDLNEEEEAANESELSAGRMQNNGRRDIINATRYMSRAAQSLTNVQPGAALPDEKSALAALQRAFVKSRYILRVLTPRERVDDQRRLSGKLDAALDWRRPVEAASDDPRSRALLKSLSDTSQLVALPRYTPVEANRLAATAESLLRLVPALSPVAQSFARAAAAIGAGQSTADVSSLIDAAAVALSAAARAGAPSAPANADPSLSRLRGALADQLRRAGGRR